MKWVALAFLLACIFPLAGWLRRNPNNAPKVWVLMGFLPFGTALHLYMAAVSWPTWPGYVKGTEFSVLDMLALAIYFSLPRGGSKLPFRLSMALYLLTVLASAIETPVPLPVIFYAWQLARMFLVYAVVAKSCADARVVPSLLTGMTLGLCFEVCDALWQHFALGVLQASGTMGSQNYLGFISHFVTYPCLALLLAGERGWRPIVAPVAGLITGVLTVSRATIGLMAMGYIALFGLSAFRKWTSRKAVVLSFGVVAILIFAPLALSSFDERFTLHPEGSYDERAAFERAAAMMLTDHPLGVGANYYVVAANTGGYNARAGVAFVIGSDSTNVHNVYYLVAAETGYIGLIAFLLMLLQPLIVAIRCGLRYRDDQRADLMLGLAMALLIVYIHSYFEWIFVTFQAQYMFAMDIGMVAGVASQLGYWRRKPMDVVSFAHPLVKTT